MNLPDYFLADLPAGATLSAAMIAEACQTLKRNRERYLSHRPTHSLVSVLSDVAQRWLEPDYPFRRLALEQGPAATGFSAPTLAAGLDCFFKQLTRENFHALMEQDLGHAQELGFQRQETAGDAQHGEEEAEHTVDGALRGHHESRATQGQNAEDGEHVPADRCK